MLYYDEIRIRLDGDLAGQFSGAMHRGDRGAQIRVFRFRYVFHGHEFSPHSKRFGLLPTLSYFVQASTAAL